MHQPVSAEVLIVEGSLPDYALRGASEEFERGHYRYLITAGGPILLGFHVSSGKTYAGLAASKLGHFGVNSNLVKIVPGPMVWRERGLAHAVAIKNWLQANDAAVRTVNVYSLGVHARRHQRLFQKVLGPDIKVGIIAHPDESYDKLLWWTSSEGVRATMGEVFAYLWMLFFGSETLGTKPRVGV